MQLLTRQGEDVEEDDIESLAKLMTTVGGLLETPEAKKNMDAYFSRMEGIVENQNTSSRLRFMLIDVIELRSHNWITRHKDAGPKSIAQIHKDAANQRAQSAADANIALSRGTSNRGPVRQESSRGPSRRGQPRGPPVQEEKGGGDGWNTIGSGAAAGGGSGGQKASQPSGNLSQFGQFSSKGGAAGAGTGTGAGASGQQSQQQPSQFGPTSVFTKKGGRGQGGSGGASPSGLASPMLSEGKSPAVSRTNSSGNMFSLLEAQDQAQNEEQPQRKKLNLLPRSATKGDVEEEQDETPASASGGKEEISDDKAKQMVKTMIEECKLEHLRSSDILTHSNTVYSLKKVSEGLESFKELPNEHKPKLIEQLIDRSLNGKKETVELTAELIAAAVDDKLVEQTQLESEIGNMMEFIEDIAIDVPNAYEFMGCLIKASKFDEKTTDRVLGKSGSDGASEKLKKYI